MCLAMNADQLKPGERCASTSNRNFEGRQGKGGAPISSARDGGRPAAPYGVTRPGVLNEYVATWMADPHLQAWIAYAQQESEVIESDEVGL
jgi:hypothetical protein